MPSLFSLILHGTHDPELDLLLREYLTPNSYIAHQYLFLFFLPIRKAKSMYHAMGYSSMLVMQAGMTFDPKDVEAAMTSLRESLETCQR